jgi:Flp pilus assembly protein TadD
MHWRDAIPSLTVVGLFALALPIGLPEPDARVSKGACLTLAERPAHDPPPDAATLEQCLELYPSDVELLTDLAEVHGAADPARAEATLRRAVALDPANGDLRLRLGRLLLARGASHEARTHAVAGLRVQPNRQELLELERAAGAGADEAAN